MKIAIINDVHVGKPLMHKGRVRSSSGSVLKIFESFLYEISKRHQPDLIINMGDLIRSDSKEADLYAYSNLLNHYKLLNIPTIHLLGNHEIKQMQIAEVEAKWQEYGFEQNSYGFRSFHEIEILWLGIGIEEGRYVLPLEQVKWLEQILGQSSKPLFIFIHCPIDNHDVSGNFFFEALDDRKKDILFIKNYESVRNLISLNSNVVAVLQAHLHYFHVNCLEDLPFITCPAMGDNICAPDIELTMPEIYTLLTIKDNQFNVKAYSREYCFAGYQQVLKK